MSFADTLDEARERFSEALQILNLLTSMDGDRLSPATRTEKSLKGLVLVLMYAAVERAVNSTVEQAIHEISSHSTPSASCDPAILSVFYYNKIQSVKDCSYENTLSKATELISSALSHTPIAMTQNPLALMLQNVDANTMHSVAHFFGINGYTINTGSAGRLNNLKERRNAIAHGRESASSAGERFNISELNQVYNCADTEVTRFVEIIKTHCEGRMYVIG